MRRPRHRSTLLLLCLALIGCQSSLPGVTSRARIPLSANVLQEGGRITLEAHLHWPARRLLNVVRPHRVEDVAVLEVTLHRQLGAMVGPALATLRLDAPATYTAPVRFHQLSPFTTYVLRGTAYDDANRVLSDAEQSEVRLTLTDDDTPPPVELQIRLRDQSFAAEAQLPAIGLAAGTRLERNRGLVSLVAGVSTSWSSGPPPHPGTRGFCLPGPDRVRYLVDTDHHRVCRLLPDGTLQTVAGDGTPGADDGVGTAARFQTPEGLALASDGTLYVADTGNHRIRAISPAGVVSTLAGSDVPGFADGTGGAARFHHPTSVVLRADGQLVVADRTNHALRLLNPSGHVSTLAGGPTPGLQDGTGSSARFNEPLALTQGEGGSLYVLDHGNQSIRGVDAWGAVGTLLTFAPETRLAGLAFVTPDQLWVANATQHTLQRISLNTGDVTTVAGTGTRGFLDGAAGTALFSNPTSLTAEADGSVWAWDAGGLRATAAGQVITVLPSGVGDRDAAGANARFFDLSGVSSPEPGVVWLADSHNHRIRMIRADGSVSTLAGSTAGFADGPSATAQFNRPWHLVAGPDGNQWVTDQGNHCIRQISDTGMVSTLAGSGEEGHVDAAGFGARFASPTGIARDAAGFLYIADTGNHCIRRITPGGVVSTWAGNGLAGTADGTGTAARFQAPEGLAIAPDGTLYVADRGNRRIRRISPEGEAETWAGTGALGAQDGPGSSATFTDPRALARGADGTLYVADGNRLRRISTAGVVETFAGDASAGLRDAADTSARFSAPRGLAIDAWGTLYVADSGNQCVRAVR